MGTEGDGMNELEEYVRRLRAKEPMVFAPELMELARKAVAQRGRPVTEADIDRLAAEAAACRD